MRLTSRSAFTPGKLLLISRISRMAFIAISCPLQPDSRASAPFPNAEALRRLLQLVSLIVATVDQRLLPVVGVHHDRGQQVRRNDLDFVVIGLGVVDLRLAARYD